MFASLCFFVEAVCVPREKIVCVPPPAKQVPRVLATVQRLPARAPQGLIPRGWGHCHSQGFRHGVLPALKRSVGSRERNAGKVGVGPAGFCEHLFGISPSTALKYLPKNHGKNWMEKRHYSLFFLPPFPHTHLFFEGFSVPLVLLLKS